MSDDVGPAELQRRMGIGKVEYEERLLAAMTLMLTGECKVEEYIPSEHRMRTGTRIGMVEGMLEADVRLEGADTDVALVVTFTVAKRIGERFGLRIPVWPAPDPTDPETGTPEGLAFIIGINFDELMQEIPSGPPAGHDNTGVTWIEDFSA